MDNSMVKAINTIDMLAGMVNRRDEQISKLERELEHSQGQFKYFRSFSDKQCKKLAKRFKEIDTLTEKNAKLESQLDKQFTEFHANISMNDHKRVNDSTQSILATANGTIADLPGNCLQNIRDPSNQ